MEAGLVRGPSESFYYLYLMLAFLVSFGITWRSRTRQKTVLFFVSYYLTAGSIGELLTFSIPGISFMEIQPDRFLFLLFSGFLINIFRFRHNRNELKKIWAFPAYEWVVYAYILFICISLTYHMNHFGVSEYVQKMTKFLGFFVIYLTMKITADKEMVKGIGLSIIIAAAFSSLISLIQLGIDPMFLRYGDMRPAFGDLLRSNGIFSSEYLNSYYLITAAVWTLLTVKPIRLRIFLVGLFIAGVLTTFHRMSWLVLALVSLIYVLRVQRVKASWLTLISLTGITLLVIFGTLFARDIMNSTVVQERLSEGIDSRFGYYEMVLNNIGDRPLFGFGDKHNEVYYESMLEITGQVARATGEAGSIHNGYLSNLFYHGVPALLLFIAFIVTLARYFYRLMRFQVLYAIPFFVALVYMISNLTNSFLFIKLLSLILGVQAGLFGGLAQKNLLPFSVPRNKVAE